MDLYLTIENGKIESKVYTKTEPIYLNPSSCHISVYKGFYKGVGLRLRLNCSKDEDFDQAVETYSRAFAISGHNYQKARAALMECKKIDRIKYLKKESNRKYFKRKKSGSKKLFWISNFDPCRQNNNKKLYLFAS